MIEAALIALYPWANTPSILELKEYFTEDEWKILDEEGVGPLITRYADVQGFTVSFLKGIHAAWQKNQSALGDSPAVFRMTVQHVAAEGKNLMEVMEWLGKDLEPFVREVVTSSDMMEHFIQTLASKDVRDALAGDIAAISRLPFIPDAFAPLQGDDLRQMIRNRSITFSVLCNTAEALYVYQAPAQRAQPSCASSSSMSGTASQPGNRDGLDLFTPRHPRTVRTVPSDLCSVCSLS